MMGSELIQETEPCPQHPWVCRDPLHQGQSIAVLSISSSSKFSLQHRTTIASHHNWNTHMQRCTRRCSLCMCRNRREQLSHHYSLEQEIAQKKQNPAVLVSGLLCVCFYPFSSKDPIHNVIYCRKLYIHCLLKLLQRKTEAVLIRVEPKNSVFSPQKLKKKTKKKQDQGLHRLLKIILQEIKPL